MTAELPTGAGLWPAFWLEPTDGVSASEIDIFEAPFNNPTLIQDSLHDTVGGYTTGQVTVPNYSTNYNTYGVNWNAQTITYYVNGQVVGSTPTPASANTAPTFSPTSPSVDSPVVARHAKLLEHLAGKHDDPEHHLQPQRSWRCWQRRWHLQRRPGHHTEQQHYQRHGRAEPGFRRRHVRHHDATPQGCGGWR